MEPDGASWGKVPREMGRDERLSTGAWRAFAILSSYANADRRCFPSQARIAQDLGASRTTSQRWIDELERAGWIMRSHQIRPHKGGWGVNAYLVAPFPQVTSDAQAYARVVGNGDGVAGRDAHDHARTVGIAMPTTEHEREQSDAHDYARIAGTNRPSLQTLQVTDPLLDRRVDHEGKLWQRLVDVKGYTREEAFLVLARGHIAALRPGQTFDAAPSANEWRAQESLADAS